jgi:hypothetical protein
MYGGGVTATFFSATLLWERSWMEKVTREPAAHTSLLTQALHNAAGAFILPYLACRSTRALEIYAGKEPGSLQA